MSRVEGRSGDRQEFTRPGTRNYHTSMNSPLPRRARFIRLPDPAGAPRVALVIRDSQDCAPQGRCTFKLRGRIFSVPLEDVTVATIVVMLQMREESAERLYAAWIDEHDPSGAEVMESLAQQEQLGVWLARREGGEAASTVIPNVLQSFARRHLDSLLEIANTSPWDLHHFAAARAHLESQFPDAQSLWKQLKTDG